jgi:competence protein ComEA
MPADPADEREARWERLRASVARPVAPEPSPGPRHALPLELTGTVRALLVVVGVALVLTVLLFWRGWPRAVEVDAAGDRVAGSLLGSEDPSEASPRPAPSTSSSVVEIVVHVVGRVRRPGVVRLPPGARVADAVAAAGGLRAGTDPATVNLARALVDGEQVVVSAGHATAPDPGPNGGRSEPESSGGAGASDVRLDLNTASAEQLEGLDGIGPVLAERIVTYRTDNGRFTSVDDLRQVSGIGPKIFAAISDQVRV